MDNLTSLIQAEYRTCAISAKAHRLVADKHRKYNNWLNIFTILVTASVGICSSVVNTEDFIATWRIVSTPLLLLASVAATLQMQMNFKLSSERHKDAGDSYSALGKEFQLLLVEHKSGLSTDDYYSKYKQYLGKKTDLSKHAINYSPSVLDDARKDFERKHTNI